MRNIMLTFYVFLFVLLSWNCEEKTTLEPLSDTDNLNKKVRAEIGTVTPVLSLEYGNSPEGIAVDGKGKIYISNSRNGRSVNEVLIVQKKNKQKLFATLPGSGQVRGLETDLFGNLYAAFATDDPNTNGVYKIGKNKNVIRLTGSKNIISPNSLVFDYYGNLYATDSDGGSIWKYGKDEIFIKWIEDPLLAGGIPPNGPPFPLPGVNGIVFYPPNKLYVANTMQNSICLIEINKNGNASGVELIKQDFLLMNIDGIAIDIYENIYGVLVASTLSAIGAPPVPPLVKLSTKTGELTSFVSDNSYFDTPTSLAFGKKFWDYKSVYITNAALQYGQPPKAGPGVVNVNIGKIGL